MKTTIIALCLFIGQALTAQQNLPVLTGNGKTIKEKRNIGDFSKLAVTGPFEVILTTGQAGSISIEGDENIIDKVTTNVSNGCLAIETEGNQPFRTSRNSRVRIKVPFTYLEEVTLTGCGSISSKKIIKTPVKTILDGSGSISLRINSSTAEACLLGSGSIKLRGSVENFKCRVIGSGSITARDLEAGLVEAVVSGSGEAAVNSGKSIKGRISGSGNVAFSGRPAAQDLKRTGSGQFIIFD